MAVSGLASLLLTSIQGGVGRTKQTPLATLGLTFLAGAYIALGGFLAIRCSAGLSWDIWGPLGKFMFAAVFPLGLVLVVLCGADLFTGDCMTLAASQYQKRIRGWEGVRSGIYAWCGNFLGALFVAYGLVVSTGLIFETVNGSMPWASSLVKLANAKTHLSFSEAFWRGVGCNWLVCLAVYTSYACKDGAGKILAMWFPTMAFVALGMEHCVANMFFVPAALFTAADPRYADLVNSGAVPAITASWELFFKDNLIPVTLGNIAGGGILVAGIYTLIHGRLPKE